MVARRLGIGAMGLMLVLGEQFVPAASVTLTPVIDTTISEGAPATGSSSEFIAGTLGNTAEGARARGLLRFDLSVIPGNAVVSEVTLLVHAVKSPLEQASSMFELHRLLQNWNESEADWDGPTDAGTWGTPGGQAGSDFASEVSSTVLVSGAVTVTPVPYTFPSGANLVADVQHWIESPGENFGWLMKTASEEVRFTARHFASRENSPPIQPQLTIVYSINPVVEQPAISNLRRSGDQFLFDFAAMAEVAYRVEFKESLSVTNWQTLTNVSAAQVAGTAVISDTIAGLQRYYRVIVP